MNSSEEAVLRGFLETEHRTAAAVEASDLLWPAGSHWKLSEAAKSKARTPGQ